MVYLSNFRFVSFKSSVQKFDECLTAHSNSKGTYIFGEVLEVVEHVEPMEVDGARRHRVVGQAQRLAQLENEPAV